MITVSTIAQTFFSVFAGLGGISILIFFHELGHFLFCKLFNIDTPSFSIGFGPKLFSRTIGRTCFIIAAIPLGGYVEIAGMLNDSVNTTPTDSTKTPLHQTFGYKPLYQKVLVLLGGIIFNLIFAYIIFSIVHFRGAPATMLLYRETAIPVIEEVIENSPAQKAGLQTKDIVTMINGKPVGKGFLMSLIGIPISSLVVLRNAQEISMSIPPEQGQGFGVLFSHVAQKGVPLGQAIRQGIATTNRWIYETAHGLLQIFKKRDFNKASGPIKIISMISKSASDGLLIYLLFLAIISINLAIFNLLPIPILDGGQLFICCIEALVRRELPLKVREYLFIGTWLLFLALILYLSYKELPFLHVITAKVQQLLGLTR